MSSRSEYVLGTVVADSMVRDEVMVTKISLDGDHDCATGAVYNAVQHFRLLVENDQFQFL